MLEPPNIVLFNRLTLVILTHLYEHFPKKIQLNTQDLVKQTLTEDTSYPDAFDRQFFANDVVKFLAEEGFVVFDHAMGTGGGFVGARLTMKGLTVLGYTPAVLKDQKPLIDRASAIVKGGFKEAGGEAVRQVVSGIFMSAAGLLPTVIQTVQQGT